MKKLIVLASAVALLVAAPAPAKTVTVDISKLGFVPNAVSVQTGDSIKLSAKSELNKSFSTSEIP